MLKPAIERFLLKINVVESGCWEWTASTDTSGYAQLKLNLKSRSAHRFIYEYYHGEIDPKLTIDHLCRNRKCVNINHLEQVTNKENILRGISFTAVNSRKTHCMHGHEFTEENTWYAENGGRDCRTCNKINSHQFFKKHRERINLKARLKRQKATAPM